MSFGNKILKSIASAATIILLAVTANAQDSGGSSGIGRTLAISFGARNIQQLTLVVTNGTEIISWNTRVGDYGDASDDPIMIAKENLVLADGTVSPWGLATTACSVGGNQGMTSTEKISTITFPADTMSALTDIFPAGVIAGAGSTSEQGGALQQGTSNNSGAASTLTLSGLTPGAIHTLSLFVSRGNVYAASDTQTFKLTSGVAGISTELNAYRVDGLTPALLDDNNGFSCRAKANNWTCATFTFTATASNVVLSTTGGSNIGALRLTQTSDPLPTYSTTLTDSSTTAWSGITWTASDGTTTNSLPAAATATITTTASTAETTPTITFPSGYTAESFLKLTFEGKIKLDASQIPITDGQTVRLISAATIVGLDNVTATLPEVEGKIAVLKKTSSEISILMGVGIGLKNYYQLDSNNDASTLGSDNTELAISTETYGYGKYGNAAVGPSYVNAGGNDFTRYNPSTGDFTFSAWVKRANTVSADTPIFTRGVTYHGSHNSGWSLIRNSSNNVILTVRKGNINSNVTSTAAITTGEWTHLAWTRQGDTATLYVNGVAGGTITGLAGVDISPVANQWYNEFRSCTDPTNSSQSMATGDAVDEIAFWTRALAAEEIQSIATYTGSIADLIAGRTRKDFTADVTAGLGQTWSGLTWSPSNFENGAGNSATLNFTGATSFDFNTDVTAALVSATGSGELSFTKSDSATLTVPTFDLSGTTGKSTISFNTGTLNVVAGSDTILQQSGTGTLTIPANSKATINNPWTTKAQTGTLVYAGTQTYNSALDLPLGVVTEIAGDITVNPSGDGRNNRFGLSSGTLNITSGTLTPKAFVTNNRGSATSTDNVVINQSGGIVNMTAYGTEPSDRSDITYPYDGNANIVGNPLFGHWSGSTTYNFSGGTFNAENRYVELGYSCNATFNQSSGLFKVKSIVGATNKGIYNLTGGTLELKERIDLPNNTRSINLGNAVVKATGSFSFKQSVALTGAETGTTIDANGNNLNLANVFDGAGKLILTNSTSTGVITLSGNNTHTGGTVISSGEVKLGHNNALGTGSVIINGGATLNLASRTLSADNALATITLGNNATAESKAVLKIRLSAIQAVSTDALKIVTLLDGTTTLPNNLAVQVYSDEEGTHEIASTNYELSVSNNVLTITPKVDALIWTGTENGNGTWNTSAENTPWNGRSFANGAITTFGNLTGVESAIVTVSGSVTPLQTLFSNTTTAYAFNSDMANGGGLIGSSGIATVENGANVTFNVPVKIPSTAAITMGSGSSLTLGAPFGTDVTADSTSGAYGGTIQIPASTTFIIAPGAGKTQTIASFSPADATSELKIGPGQLSSSVRGGGIGIFGQTKVTILDGGILLFNQGDISGYDIENNPIIVEAGGELRYEIRDTLHRGLELHGGLVTVAGAESNRALDLFLSQTIKVTKDSQILGRTGVDGIDNPLIRLRGQATTTFNVDAGVTLTCAVTFENENANVLSLTGSGKMIQNGMTNSVSGGFYPLTYTSNTQIAGGTTYELNVTHNNGGGTYAVADGAKLMGSGEIAGNGKVTLENNAALEGSLRITNLKLNGSKTRLFVTEPGKMISVTGNLELPSTFNMEIYLGERTFTEATRIFAWNSASVSTITFTIGDGKTLPTGYKFAASADGVYVVPERSLTWIGGADAKWDFESVAWDSNNDGTADTAFTAGADVVFASETLSIPVNANVNPATITFTDNVQNVTFAPAEGATATSIGCLLFDCSTLASFESSVALNGAVTAATATILNANVGGRLTIPAKASATLGSTVTASSYTNNGTIIFEAGHAYVSAVGGSTGTVRYKDMSTNTGSPVFGSELAIENGDSVTLSNATAKFATRNISISGGTFNIAGTGGAWVGSSDTTVNQNGGSVLVSTETALPADNDFGNKGFLLSSTDGGSTRYNLFSGTFAATNTIINFWGANSTFTQTGGRVDVKGLRTGNANTSTSGWAYNLNGGTLALGAFGTTAKTANVLRFNLGGGTLTTLNGSSTISLPIFVTANTTSILKSETTTTNETLTLTGDLSGSNGAITIENNVAMTSASPAFNGSISISSGAKLTLGADLPFGNFVTMSIANGGNLVIPAIDEGATTVKLFESPLGKLTIVEGGTITAGETSLTIGTGTDEWSVKLNYLVKNGSGIPVEEGGTYIAEITAATATWGGDGFSWVTAAPSTYPVNVQLISSLDSASLSATAETTLNTLSVNLVAESELTLNANMKPGLLDLSGTFGTVNISDTFSYDATTNIVAGAKTVLQSGGAATTTLTIPAGITVTLTQNWLGNISNAGTLNAGADISIDNKVSAPSAFTLSAESGKGLTVSDDANLAARPMTITGAGTVKYETASTRGTVNVRVDGGTLDISSQNAKLFNTASGITGDGRLSIVNGGSLITRNWNWDNSLGKLQHNTGYIVINNGTVRFTESMESSDRGPRFEGNGGTFSIDEGCSATFKRKNQNGAFSYANLTAGAKIVLTGKGTGVLNTPITGSIGLDFNGGGTWTINPQTGDNNAAAQNDYTGGTKISGGTSLTIGAVSALGAGDLTIDGSNTVAIGTLQLPNNVILSGTESQGNPRLAVTLGTLIVDSGKIGKLSKLDDSAALLAFDFTLPAGQTVLKRYPIATIDASATVDTLISTVNSSVANKTAAEISIEKFEVVNGVVYVFFTGSDVTTVAYPYHLYLTESTDYDWNNVANWRNALGEEIDVIPSELNSVVVETTDGITATLNIAENTQILGNLGFTLTGGGNVSIKVAEGKTFTGFEKFDLSSSTGDITLNFPVNVRISGNAVAGSLTFDNAGEMSALSFPKVTTVYKGETTVKIDNYIDSTDFSVSGNVNINFIDGASFVSTQKTTTMDPTASTSNNPGTRPGLRLRPNVKFSFVNGGRFEMPDGYLEMGWDTAGGIEFNVIGTNSIANIRGFGGVNQASSAAPVKILDGGVLQLGNLGFMSVRDIPLTMSNGTVRLTTDLTHAMRGVRMTLAAGSVNTFDVQGYTLNYNQIISGAGSLAIVGDTGGAVTLSAVNTFTGGIAMNGGTLNLTAASAAGTGTVDMNRGTTLNATILGAIAGNLNLNAGVTFSPNLSGIVAGNLSVNSGAVFMPQASDIITGNIILNFGGLLKLDSKKNLISADKQLIFNGGSYESSTGDILHQPVEIAANGGAFVSSGSTELEISGDSPIAFVEGATLTLGGSGDGLVSRAFSDVRKNIVKDGLGIWTLNSETFAKNSTISVKNGELVANTAASVDGADISVERAALISIMEAGSLKKLHVKEGSVLNLYVDDLTQTSYQITKVTDFDAFTLDPSASVFVNGVYTEGTAVFGSFVPSIPLVDTVVINVGESDSFASPSWVDSSKAVRFDGLNDGALLIVTGGEVAAKKIEFTGSNMTLIFDSGAYLFSDTTAENYLNGQMKLDLSRWNFKDLAAAALPNIPINYPLIIAATPNIGTWNISADLNVSQDASKALPEGYTMELLKTVNGIYVQISAPSSLRKNTINFNFAETSNVSGSEGLYRVSSSGWNMVKTPFTGPLASEALYNLVLSAGMIAPSDVVINTTSAGVIATRQDAISILKDSISAETSAITCTFSEIPFAKYRVVVYLTAPDGTTSFAPVAINGVPYSALTHNGTNIVMSSFTGNWGDPAVIGTTTLGTNVIASDLIKTSPTCVISIPLATTSACNNIAAVQFVEVTDAEIVAEPVNYTALIENTAAITANWSELSWQVGDTPTPWENNFANTATITYGSDLTLNLGELIVASRITFISNNESATLRLVMPTGGVLTQLDFSGVKGNVVVDVATQSSDIVLAEKTTTFTRDVDADITLTKAGQRVVFNGSFGKITNIEGASVRIANTFVASEGGISIGDSEDLNFVGSGIWEFADLQAEGETIVFYDGTYRALAGDKLVAGDLSFAGPVTEFAGNIKAATMSTKAFTASENSQIVVTGALILEANMTNNTAEISCGSLSLVPRATASIVQNNGTFRFTSSETTTTVGFLLNGGTLATTGSTTLNNRITAPTGSGIKLETVGNGMFTIRPIFMNFVSAPVEIVKDSTVKLQAGPSTNNLNVPCLSSQDSVTNTVTVAQGATVIIEATQDRTKFDFDSTSFLDVIVADSAATNFVFASTSVGSPTILRNGIPVNAEIRAESRGTVTFTEPETSNVDLIWVGTTENDGTWSVVADNKPWKTADTAEPLRAYQLGNSVTFGDTVTPSDEVVVSVVGSLSGKVAFTNDNTPYRFTDGGKGFVVATNALTFAQDQVKFDVPLRVENGITLSGMSLGLSLFSDKSDFARTAMEAVYTNALVAVEDTVLDFTIPTGKRQIIENFTIPTNVTAGVAMRKFGDGSLVFNIAMGSGNAGTLEVEGGTVQLGRDIDNPPQLFCRFAHVTVTNNSTLILNGRDVLNTGSLREINGTIESRSYNNLGIIKLNNGTIYSRGGLNDTWRGISYSGITATNNCLISSADLSAVAQQHHLRGGRITVEADSLLTVNAVLSDFPNYADEAAAELPNQLVKEGVGDLIINAAPIYSGTTRINGGTLYLNADQTIGGAYFVAADATLGGSGSIASSVNVASNGTIQAGLTIKSRTIFDSHSRVALDLTGVTLLNISELSTSTEGAVIVVDALGAMPLSMKLPTKILAWNNNTAIGVKWVAGERLRANNYSIIEKDDGLYAVNAPAYSRSFVASSAPAWFLSSWTKGTEVNLPYPENDSIYPSVKISADTAVSASPLVNISIDRKLNASDIEISATKAGAIVEIEYLYNEADLPTLPGEVLVLQYLPVIPIRGENVQSYSITAKNPDADSYTVTYDNATTVTIMKTLDFNAVSINLAAGQTTTLSSSDMATGPYPLAGSSWNQQSAGSTTGSIKLTDATGNTAGSMSYYMARESEQIGSGVTSTMPNTKLTGSGIPCGYNAATSVNINGVTVMKPAGSGFVIKLDGFKRNFSKNAGYYDLYLVVAGLANSQATTDYPAFAVSTTGVTWTWYGASANGTTAALLKNSTWTGSKQSTDNVLYEGSNFLKIRISSPDVNTLYIAGGRGTASTDTVLPGLAALQIVEVDASETDLVWERQISGDWTSRNWRANGKDSQAWQNAAQGSPVNAVIPSAIGTVNVNDAVKASSVKLTGNTDFEFRGTEAVDTPVIDASEHTGYLLFSAPYSGIINTGSSDQILTLNDYVSGNRFAYRLNANGARFEKRGLGTDTTSTLNIDDAVMPVRITSGTLNFEVSNGRTSTFNKVISGDGSFIKTGDGTMVLTESPATTIAGLDVKEGTLTINANVSGLTNVKEITVAKNSTLNIRGHQQANRAPNGSTFHVEGKMTVFGANLFNNNNKPKVVLDNGGVFETGVDTENHVKISSLTLNNGSSVLLGRGGYSSQSLVIDGGLRVTGAGASTLGRATGNTDYSNYCQIGSSEISVDEGSILLLNAPVGGSSSLIKKIGTGTLRTGVDLALLPNNSNNGQNVEVVEGTWIQNNFYNAGNANRTFNVSSNAVLRGTGSFNENVTVTIDGGRLEMGDNGAGMLGIQNLVLKGSPTLQLVAGETLELSSLNVANLKDCSVEIRNPDSLSAAITAGKTKLVGWQTAPENLSNVTWSSTDTLSAGLELRTQADGLYLASVVEGSFLTWNNFGTTNLTWSDAADATQAANWLSGNVSTNWPRTTAESERITAKFPLTTTNLNSLRIKITNNGTSAKMIVLDIAENKALDFYENQSTNDPTLKIGNSVWKMGSGTATIAVPVLTSPVQALTVLGGKLAFESKLSSQAENADDYKAPISIASGAELVLGGMFVDRKFSGVFEGSGGTVTLFSTNSTPATVTIASRANRPFLHNINLLRGNMSLADTYNLVGNTERRVYVTNSTLQVSGYGLGNLPRQTITLDTGAAVQFSSSPKLAARTVTVAGDSRFHNVAPELLSDITFDVKGNVTLTNEVGFAGSSSSVVTKTGAGTLAINGNAGGFAGSINVEAGTLALGAISTRVAPLTKTWTVQKDAKFTIADQAVLEFADGASLTVSGSLAPNGNTEITALTLNDVAVLHYTKVGAMIRTSTIKTDGTVLVNIDNAAFLNNTTDVELLSWKVGEGTRSFTFTGNNQQALLDAGYTLKTEFNSETATYTLVLKSLGTAYRWVGTTTNTSPNWTALQAWATPDAGSEILKTWDNDANSSGGISARFLDSTDTSKVYTNIVTITDLMRVNTVQVNNSNWDYTIKALSNNGRLRLSGDVIKLGTGAVEFSAPLVMDTGAVQLSAGKTIFSSQLGQSSSLSHFSRPIFIGTGAEGVFGLTGSSYTNTLSGVITGEGTLTKEGGSALLFTRDFSSLTTILKKGSIIQANGLTILPAVAVNSGATYVWQDRTNRVTNLSGSITGGTGNFTWAGTSPITGEPSTLGDATLEVVEFMKSGTGKLALSTTAKPVDTANLTVASIGLENALVLGGDVTDVNPLKFANLAGSGTIQPASASTPVRRTLALMMSRDNTFAGSFVDNGSNAKSSLALSGGHTMTMSGTSSSTGSITLSDSTRLNVTGLWTGDVNAGSGTVVSGTGTIGSISGAGVTVATDAEIYGGTSVSTPGILKIAGTLTLQADSILTVNVAADGSTSLIQPNNVVINTPVKIRVNNPYHVFLPSIQLMKITTGVMTRASFVMEDSASPYSVKVSGNTLLISQDASRFWILLH